MKRTRFIRTIALFLAVMMLCGLFGMSGAAADGSIISSTIEDLRELCMHDLDGAMHMALKMSLEHVIAQGKTLHPDTLAALKTYEPEQTV